MRIISSDPDISMLQALLPSGLKQWVHEWSPAIWEGFTLKADLLYSDVISAGTLMCLPELLGHMGEQRCFIYNHGALISGGRRQDLRNVAIEIESTSDPQDILREFDPAGSMFREYSAIFYLSGDSGIVSESGEWFVFASPASRAVLFSNDEVKYSLFNATWWKYSIRGLKPILDTW